MTYNILAINPGHNGSSALIVDGKTELYIEEERLSRRKYDANPYKGMIDIMNDYHIDELVIAGTGQENHTLPWTGEDSYSALVRKFYPDVKITKIGHEHHLGHAATAFYNSGFEEAMAIVVDGAGSKHDIKLHKDPDNNERAEGYECESIWKCSYPHTIEPVFKSYGNNDGGMKMSSQFQGVFDDAVTLTKSYEAVSMYLGFGFIEAGKTMGLAPYGEDDKNIPPLFHNGRGSKDIFIPSYPAGALIDEARNPQLMRKFDPKEWHNSPDKLPDIAKNLAWRIQRDTQEILLYLIKQTVENTGIKNIVLAGGYGLNCVANYYFQKNIKKDGINLYVEPISHDGGCSIGVAKLFDRIRTQSKEIDPGQTTLYYGPLYNNNDIEDFINNEEDLNITDVKYLDIAKLISERNIVAIWQGRSEAGPRALGNRSILYDPRDPDGKDNVNKVKGREWFRPFAGSVLLEDANDWFDMAGLKESPYMMYAVDTAFDKVDEIPAINHVDNTCRIQTVTKEQNEHYYNLISSFKDLTDVPVLFNTSFNLAGDPLVETIQDAVNTLRKSKMEYLYLPELGKLVHCETFIEPVEEDIHDTSDIPFPTNTKVKVEDENGNEVEPDSLIEEPDDEEESTEE